MKYYYILYISSLLTYILHIFYDSVSISFHAQRVTVPHKLHNFQIHSRSSYINNRIARKREKRAITSSPASPRLFRDGGKFHGTFGFMKRSVVTYTKYPENRERCRVKSMGHHISVKSPGNPAICIYFPPGAFFRRGITMKNSTRYPVFAAPSAGKNSLV